MSPEGRWDVGRVRALYPALADGYAYLDGAAGTQVPADGDRRHRRRPTGPGSATSAARSRPAGARTRSSPSAGGPWPTWSAGMPDGVILGPNMTTLTYRLAAALAAGWAAGRRGGGVPARPRRQRPALGAGRGQGRGDGALGRGRPGHRRAAGRPVRGAGHRADPAGRGQRGQQRARHPARRGRDHGHRPRRRRPDLRGRGARRRPRAGGRGRARAPTSTPPAPTSGPARTSAPWSPTRPCWRRSARTSWPRPRTTVPGAVRAGHLAVRRLRRGGGRRRPPGLARPGRRRHPPPAGAGLDGRRRGLRAGAVRGPAERPGGDGARDHLRQGGPADGHRLLHRGRPRPRGRWPSTWPPAGSTSGTATTTPGS